MILKTFSFDFSSSMSIAYFNFLVFYFLVYLFKMQVGHEFYAAIFIHWYNDNILYSFPINF